MRTSLSHLISSASRSIWHIAGAPSRAALGSRALRAAQRPAAALCWIILGALILWDIALAMDDIEGNTWSEVTRVAGERFPVIPFMLGALVGHLFHPFGPDRCHVPHDAARTSLSALCLVFALGGAFGVPLPGSSTVNMALGLLAGAALWPGCREEGWRW